MPANTLAGTYGTGTYGTGAYGTGAYGTGIYGTYGAGLYGSSLPFLQVPPGLQKEKNTCSENLKWER